MINSIIRNGVTVTKKFSRLAEIATYVVSHIDNRLYFNNRDRFMTELGRLDFYGGRGLPVPEIVSIDYPRLAIEMRQLPGKNISEAILDGDLTDMQLLRYLERYAEVLRQIHQHGEHGDPFLRNAMVSNGSLYAIDFEHTRRNGKSGDLSALFMDALRRTDIKYGDVKRAITYGYGEEPRELYTPMVRMPSVILPAERFLHRHKFTL